MKLNINGPKVIGLIGCAVAAIAAFVSEHEKQNQADTIKNLTDRVSKLERES